jgi:hypothetical protein
MMPLSQAPARRKLEHARRVTCDGYQRDDGLWDIEGHITDQKPEPFQGLEHKYESGDLLHDMWLRLTIDERMVVVAVEAVTDHAPHSTCPAITPAFQKLVGLSIAKGFKAAVRERLGGVQGCTHLVELLGPMGTTAMQTLARHFWAKAKEPGAPKRRPTVVNTCHVWNENSELVKRHMPDFHVPAGSDPS